MTGEAGADARRWARFFEVYEGLPRGGPGDSASSRRAHDLMTGLPSHPRVVDVGCGPGRGSVELALLTGGRVAALDRHKPFVMQQAAAARRAALTGRVAPVCADMRAAPFAAGSFDLAWSEGALYSIGFGEGLAACLRLVKPGGYIAASEAVWKVPHPPDPIRRWWDAEYPDIASIEEKAAVVASAGIDVVGHFTLPASAWWEHYYVPMRQRLAELRIAWAGNEPDLGILAQFDTEIVMFERWGHTYGYEFFVGRAPISTSR